MRGAQSVQLVAGHRSTVVLPVQLVYVDGYNVYGRTVEAHLHVKAPPRVCVGGHHERG